MKILIYEKAEKNTKITPHLLHYLHNQEFTFAQHPKHAEEVLKAETIDIAIIHHHCIDETERMKKISPNTKYIGYTGSIGATWFNTARGSSIKNTHAEFSDKLMDTYDALILYPGDILETLVKLEMQKKRK